MNPDATATNQDDAALEAQIRSLMGTLPKPVRDFVASDRLDSVATALSRKYQLRDEQKAEFHLAFILLLLGVYSPERFANTLEDRGFPVETVEGLIIDLNEQVFAPLRKEERAWSLEEKKKAPTPEPVRTPAPPLAPVPAPIEPPRPTTPVTPVPSVPPPAAPVPVPQPVALAEEPTMRTMALDVEAMKDGHTPAPVRYAMPAPAAPAMTVIRPVVAPAPVIASPQPTKPLAPTRPLIVEPPKADDLPPHPVRTPGTPDPKEVTSTLQKYGIDPYRESPE